MLKVPAIPYPGGKGGAGVYHQIIGVMPPHQVYIEAFVGGGAVLRHKAAAPCSIVVDLDKKVIDGWLTIAGQAEAAGTAPPPQAALTVIHGDGIRFLRHYPWTGQELVYCDPPYLRATRRGGDLYNHEMSDRQHQALLDVLAGLPVPFLLSGYRHAMYNDAADRHGWHSLDFKAMTRRGVRIETLWMNFEPPAERHDYRYLGTNFRERERIKRKQARWRAKLEKMPRAEQLAMMKVLEELTNLVPAP